MQYQFQVNDTLIAEIRRIIELEITAAIHALQSSPDPHEGIHDCRKALKRTRAVLRLTRSSFPAELYLHANHTCRDQGRILSAIRDATALIETWDKLKSKHPDWLTEEIFQAIRGRFIHRRETLFTLSIQSEKINQRVIHTLEAFKMEIPTWQLAGNTFDQVMSAGLLRAYQKGNKLFNLAYTHPTEENFHEWRKRVKDLWYHNLLLTGSWPEMVSPYAEAVHLLSGLLGDEHDLNIFMGLVKNGRIPLPDTADTSQLFDVLHTEVDHLRTTANTVAKRVYGEKGQSYVRRMERYWETAN